VTIRVGVDTSPPGQPVAKSPTSPLYLRLLEIAEDAEHITVLKSGDRPDSSGQVLDFTSLQCRRKATDLRVDGFLVAAVACAAAFPKLTRLNLDGSFRSYYCGEDVRVLADGLPDLRTFCITINARDTRDGIRFCSKLTKLRLLSFHGRRIIFKTAHRDPTAPGFLKLSDLDKVVEPQYRRLYSH
jgi:hypothetical protein